MSVPLSLAAALATAATLTGCASAGSAGSSPAVAITASDSDCSVAETTLTAGKTAFAIQNSGSKATEVYVYGAGDKIVAEKENIGPGLTVSLTVALQQGSYTVVCKPGMTGDGIRTAVTVS